jgi:NAD(P)H-dependent nitrite reductase small subunit
MTMTATAAQTTALWLPICPAADLTPDRGVAALVGDEQVAIFLLSPESRAGDDPSGPSDPSEIYAVDNHDPYSGANVIARGLVGSAGDRPIVASPIYKERFDLRDGTCLDGDRSLRTWAVRIVDGWVEIGQT